MIVNREKPGEKIEYGKPSLGFTLRPSFRITAVEDERTILLAFQEKFGVGAVYCQERTGNSKNSCQYYVDTMDELSKIIDFFKDKHFYTTKGESFKLWCECLEIIRQKQHLQKDGFLRICELRDKMNFRLGGKNSRTRDLIEKILGVKAEHIEHHAKQTNLIHNNSGFDMAVWVRGRKGHLRLAGSNLFPQNTPKTP